MSDEIERESADEFIDDSLEYEKAQAEMQSDDDPLAAIKAMRLEQLAVCRLKSEQEITSEIRKQTEKHKQSLASAL